MTIATPEEPVTKAPRSLFRDGHRVRITSSGGRDYLNYTVGMYGHVEQCWHEVTVVHFEGGGQFSYPVNCLQKAPLILNAP